jgi:hypothetical protein
MSSYVYNDGTGIGVDFATVLFVVKSGWVQRSFGTSTASFVQLETVTNTINIKKL